MEAEVGTFSVWFSFFSHLQHNHENLLPCSLKSLVGFRFYLRLTVDFFNVSHQSVIGYWRRSEF